MKLNLWSALSLIIVASIVLTACGGGNSTGTSPTGAAAPAPLAPDTLEVQDIQTLTTKPVTELAPSHVPSTGTPELITAEKTVLLSTQTPAEELNELDIITIEDEDMFNEILIWAAAADAASKIEGQSVNVALSLPSGLSAQGPYDCSSMAQRLVKHLTDLDHPERMTRLSQKYAWETLFNIFDAMAKGNVIVRGFVVAYDDYQRAVWFKFLDPITNRWREVMLILTSKYYASKPTLYPMGENVKLYGAIEDAVVKVFRNLAGYVQSTGEWGSHVYLTEEALRIVNKIGLGFGSVLITAAIMGEATQFLNYWGKCFEQEVKKTKAYREWKEKKDSAESGDEAAQFALTMPYVSQEDAEAGAKALVAIGVTVVVVKVIIGITTQQYWVILVPVPL